MLKLSSQYIPDTPELEAFSCGGILTGDEIKNSIQNKKIEIDPFDPCNLNPNSYNLTITDKLVEIENDVIDIKNLNKLHYIEHTIPEHGLMLLPNKLYLIATKEKVSTDYFIPIITGRSSIGRIGISVHNVAGFGDIGFSGNWTLQVKVTYSTIIYPNISISQIYFSTPYGNIDLKYSGKYQNSNGIAPSKLDIELNNKK